MTETEHSSKYDQETTAGTEPGRASDDRRQEVKPTDNPVPRSPEPEEDSVRAALEKLDRVKPY